MLFAGRSRMARRSVSLFAVLALAAGLLVSIAGVSPAEAKQPEGCKKFKLANGTPAYYATEADHKKKRLTACKGEAKPLERKKFEGSKLDGVTPERSRVQNSRVVSGSVGAAGVRGSASVRPQKPGGTSIPQFSGGPAPVVANSACTQRTGYAATDSKTKKPLVCSSRGTWIEDSTPRPAPVVPNNRAQ